MNKNVSIAITIFLVLVIISICFYNYSGTEVENKSVIKQEKPIDIGVKKYGQKSDKRNGIKVDRDDDESEDLSQGPKELVALLSDDQKTQRDAINSLRSLDNIENVFQKYGNKVFPYIDHVISDLSNENSRAAIGFLFRVAEYDAMKNERGSLSAIDKNSLEELQQRLPNTIPDLASYAPLKASLVNILNNSSDHKSRGDVSLILAKGFEPGLEIEQILMNQYALEKNQSVRSKILGGLTELTYSDQYANGLLSPETMPMIVSALDSNVASIVQTASFFITKYKPPSAIPKLREMIYETDSNIAFTSALYSLSSYENFNSEYSFELEQYMNTTKDAQRKRIIENVLNQVRN